MTRSTDPVMALMVSDLRMSRHEMDMRCRLEIPFLRLLEQVIRSSTSQGHNGQRRLLIGLGYETRTVSNEKIRHVVGLAISVQRRSCRTFSHSRGPDFMNDDASIGNSEGMILALLRGRHVDAACRLNDLAIGFLHVPGHLK